MKTEQIINLLEKTRNWHNLRADPNWLYAHEYKPSDMVLHTVIDKEGTIKIGKEQASNESRVHAGIVECIDNILKEIER